MARLPLTFASCRYDRVEALRTGDVRPDGIDLKMQMFAAGREIFDRMVGAREFDVAELSGSDEIENARRGTRR
jgi:4,5-dihydroxyphthalate decarboxylase